MPIQAPPWTDFMLCPVCEMDFDERHRIPISIACGHTICIQCNEQLTGKQCPFDQSGILGDFKTLPSNLAILQLLEVDTRVMRERIPPSVPPEFAQMYITSWKCIEELAVHLRPLTKLNRNNAENLAQLSKPLQRKLVTLINCQLVLEEGRARAVRAARSLGERTVTELILQHQYPQQLSANLWAAVRARGCQFLGPAMQDETLNLVLLALENGVALSRKVLVLFVVQRLEQQFPQASKTSVGHVVQLLYRASCFKVTKRDEESSLMQLKEEFRTIDALRREHDAQIVQIAIEAGLRISPEQWSSLLYGDLTHKSHMQSIIDKLQNPASFSSSIQELTIALQRSGDPANLSLLRPRLEQLASIDPSTEIKTSSWNEVETAMLAVREIIDGLVKFLHKYSYTKKALEQQQTQNIKYKTSMCRDIQQRGGCPRGSSCTFAHSEEELDRHRARSRKMLTAINRQGSRNMDRKIMSDELSLDDFDFSQDRTDSLEGVSPLAINSAYTQFPATTVQRDELPSGYMTVEREPIVEPMRQPLQANNDKLSRDSSAAMPVSPQLSRSLISMQHKSLGPSARVPPLQPVIFNQLPPNLHPNSDKLSREASAAMPVSPQPSRSPIPMQHKSLGPSARVPPPQPVILNQLPPKLHRNSGQYYLMESLPGSPQVPRHPGGDEGKKVVVGPRNVMQHGHPDLTRPHIVMHAVTEDRNARLTHTMQHLTSPFLHAPGLQRLQDTKSANFLPNDMLPKLRDYGDSGTQPKGKAVSVRKGPSLEELQDRKVKIEYLLEDIQHERREVESPTINLANMKMNDSFNMVSTNKSSHMPDVHAKSELMMKGEKPYKMPPAKYTTTFCKVQRRHLSARDEEEPKDENVTVGKHYMEEFQNMSQEELEKTLIQEKQAASSHYERGSKVQMEILRRSRKSDIASPQLWSNSDYSLPSPFLVPSGIPTAPKLSSAAVFRNVSGKAMTKGKNTCPVLVNAGDNHKTLPVMLTQDCHVSPGIQCVSGEYDMFRSTTVWQSPPTKLWDTMPASTDEMKDNNRQELLQNQLFHVKSKIKDKIDEKRANDTWLLQREADALGDTWGQRGLVGALLNSDQLAKSAWHSNHSNVWDYNGYKQGKPQKDNSVLMPLSSRPYEEPEVEDRMWEYESPVSVGNGSIYGHNNVKTDDSTHMNGREASDSSQVWSYSNKFP